MTTNLSFPPPHVREYGSGPGVVCLHANASTSSQWKLLGETLSARYRVLAPDSLGAGRSRPWPTGRRVTLRDEVDFLAPVLERAGSPCALVGHSYGAAVALVAALARPRRVSRLVVYEPTLFALLEEESPGQAAAEEIRQVADDAAASVRAGDPGEAARRFIDYWMGEGAWERTPDSRQPAVAASMANIEGWAGALFGERTHLDAFRSLQVPVLYLVGAASPASSRGVARLLTGALPRVRVVELDGLGHMGPVTDPVRVNKIIAEFLN